MKPVQIFCSCLLILVIGSCANRPKETGGQVQKIEENFTKPISIPKIKNLDFERITVDNGLSSNSITCIFQDKQGFLWIGTDNGLNRFDGYNYTHYFHDINNSNSILGNKILEIKSDSKGLIWVMTSQGLSSINPQTASIETYSDSLFTKRATVTLYYSGMLIDQNNKIWINGQNQSVIFDIASKKFIPTIFESKFQDFFETSDKKILALCRDISEPNKGFQEIKIFKSNDSIDDFAKLIDTLIQNEFFTYRRSAIDGKGNIWIGGIKGLTECDLSNKKNYFYKLPFGYIYQLFYSKSADVFWLSNKNGLVRYELGKNNKHETIHYEHQEYNLNSLPENWITTSLEDATGNLWVGTQNRGLVHYSPSRQNFALYKRRFNDISPLPSNDIKALYFDHNNKLWVGTSKGLSVLEDARNHSFHNIPPFTDTLPNIVGAIKEDTIDNKLYLGYWGNYISVIDLKTQKLSLLPADNLPKGVQSCPVTHVNDIFIKDREIYFSNRGGASLCKYSIPDKQFIYFECDDEAVRVFKKKFISHFSISIWVDNYKKVWLGTNEEGKGLQVFDLQKGETFLEDYYEDSNMNLNIKRIGAVNVFRENRSDPTKLQNSIINSIFEDSKKRLWQGTDGGLQLLKNRRKGIFEKFGYKHGFPSEAIKAILEDDHGRLWVSTNKGICCFDPDSYKVVASYNVGDGLQGSQFNQNSCAKSKDGYMAFGGIDGFNVFHPDSLKVNTYRPRTAITSLEVNGIAKNMDKKLSIIKLASNERNITLSFAALDFSNPSKNRFRYYLEGLEDTWSEPTNNHQKTYNNLRPGKYYFHVKGCNNDGIWDERGETVSLKINQPYYSDIKVIIPFCILFLYVIRFTLRRLNKKRKDNRQKMYSEIQYLQAQANQAQLNSHFTANVLQVIQGHIINNNIKDAVNNLSNLAKLIRRFLDSSIESGMPSKGFVRGGISLIEEIELLELYINFEHSLDPNKFGYKINVHDSLNPSIILLQPMLIQPFVENAIKHGFYHKEDRGFLGVHFFPEKAKLVCIIEDNGVGRKKAKEIEGSYIKPYKSRGYSLAKRRMKILNALNYEIDFNIDDRPEGGTIVTFKFPMS